MKSSDDLKIGWITPLLPSTPPWSLVSLIHFFTLLRSELFRKHAVAALAHQ